MKLFIDIETVSGNKNLNILPETLINFWNKKSSFIKLTEDEVLDPNLAYFNRAGIYAEFGKIVCIGIGVILSDKKIIRIKTISNQDEKTLLNEFNKLVTQQEMDSKSSLIFVGHNIKEFDIPYLCRRMIINNIQLPKSLQLAGLKPWQIEHIDTLQLWQFGDYKHYTSLDLLATILNVPSSKSDIDGSQVSQVYWEENDLERIAKYCAKDIFTTALVYLRLEQKSIEGYQAQFVNDA